MNKVLLLFVRKHINPALKSCHWADKYVLELCVMSPTVVGSSLGKVREREERSAQALSPTEGIH